MELFETNKMYRQQVHDQNNLLSEMVLGIKAELENNPCYCGKLDFWDYEDNNISYAPMVRVMDEYNQTFEDLHVDIVEVDETGDVMLTLEPSGCHSKTIPITELSLNEVFELYHSIATISDNLA